MSKREGGQGIVEYAVILLLVILTIGMIVWCVNYISTRNSNPPAMDAPMLDIVRWCESHARDTYITTSTVPVQVGKTTTIQTRSQTHVKDDPEKFVSCMQQYEYIVKR